MAIQDAFIPGVGEQEGMAPMPDGFDETGLPLPAMPMGARPELPTGVLPPMPQGAIPQPPPMLAGYGLPEIPTMALPALPGLPPEPMPEMPPAAVATPVEPVAAPSAVPVAEVPEEEFAPVAVSGVAGVAETAGQLSDFGARLEELGSQQDRFDKRIQEIRQEAEGVTDPQALAALGGRYEAVVAARNDVRSQRDALRRTVDETTAKAAALQSLSEAEIAASSAAETQRKADELRAQFAAREEERADTEEQARQQLEQDRQSYRALLKAGPRESGIDIGHTIGSMLTEALRASVSGTIPNFDPILNRATQQAREKFEGRAKDQMRIVGLSQDQVTDSLAFRRELKAQEAAARAAILEDAEIALRSQLAQTQVPLARANVQMQVDAVARKREQAEAMAAQARYEAEDKRRKSQAELALTQARTDKERALAEKALIEAKKEARAGRGVSTAAPGLIPEFRVTVPGTDAKLVDFPDTARGRKEATTTRATLGAQAKALERINRVRALYEDAEKAGLLKSLGVRGSELNEELTTQLAFLRNDLALVKSGGLATTEGDDKWAGNLAPPSPKTWTNKESGLRKLDALAGVIEDEARSQLQSKTRLDAATRESIVRKARVRRISQTQRAQAEASRAASILGDESATADARKKALDNLEENARKKAKDTGGDWLEIAAAEMIATLPSIEDDEVRRAAEKRAQRYMRFATRREETARAGSLGKLSGGLVPKVGPVDEAKKAEADRYKALAERLKEATE